MGMWVLEFLAELLMPKRWEEYQAARYDYEGYVAESAVGELRGSELWCRARGKRLRPVQVVLVGGRRMRVRFGT